MMASNKLFVVCVVLCTVRSGHSVQIRGTMRKNSIELPSEVAVSNYVNGEDFNKVVVLTLDRLVDAETLPALTIANFKSIEKLILTDIALEHVPLFLNTTISKLYIWRNKIKSVPANAFSGPRPSLLELSFNGIQSMADQSINIGANVVYLGCNELSNFSQSWFEDPGNIELLSLSGNRIGRIQDRAFDQMTKLKVVHLSYNHLTSIGSEAFPSGLIQLYLEFNDITQLTADMFARRRRGKPMRYLFLHHNQLNYLPEALLLKLKPMEITLFGNPWQCQCLRDIERWIRELNSTRLDIPARRGEPVCVVPLSFQNVCIAAVDTELQQTYARALSPMPECLATSCKPCNNREYLSRDFQLTELT